jgi:hypothetical protein
MEHDAVRQLGHVVDTYGLAVADDFDWARELMDDEERERLAGIALACLKLYSVHGPQPVDPTAEGRRRATLEQIRAIGWVESRLFADHVRDAVYGGIVRPLATYGIVLDASMLERFFGVPPPRDRRRPPRLDEPGAGAGAGQRVDRPRHTFR